MKLDCKFVVQLAHICSCLEGLSIDPCKGPQGRAVPSTSKDFNTEEMKGAAEEGENDRGKKKHANILLLYTENLSHKKNKHTSPIIIFYCGNCHRTQLAIIFTTQPKKKKNLSHFIQISIS